MQRRTDSAPGPESDLRVPIAEQLLIDFEIEAAPARVLCTSLGRGQLAADCARRWPAAAVVCHFIDLYPAEEARELYEWFLPLLRLDTVPKFVQLIKLVQQECGLGSEQVRAPRLVLEGAERETALGLIRERLAQRSMAQR